MLLVEVVRGPHVIGIEEEGLGAAEDGRPGLLADEVRGRIADDGADREHREQPPEIHDLVGGVEPGDDEEGVPREEEDERPGLEEDDQRERRQTALFDDGAWIAEEGQ